MLEKVLKNRPSIREMRDFIPKEKNWSVCEQKIGKIFYFLQPNIHKIWGTSQSQKYFIPNPQHIEDQIEKIGKTNTQIEFDNVAKSFEKFEENKDKGMTQKKLLKEPPNQISSTIPKVFISER